MIKKSTAHIVLVLLVIIVGVLVCVVFNIVKQDKELSVPEYKIQPVEDKNIMLYKDKYEQYGIKPREAMYYESR